MRAPRNVGRRQFSFVNELEEGGSADPDEVCRLVRRECVAAGVKHIDVVTLTHDLACSAEDILHLRRKSPLDSIVANQTYSGARLEQGQHFHDVCSDGGRRLNA